MQYLGPPDPPPLQAVSLSGDTRLTLRRYTPADTLSNTALLLRLDLRIHPRDLYAIPSDGHCGYHSLAVLAHPHYPDPPSTAERQEILRRLLEGLSLHPHQDLRTAALAACRHPPPSPLPRSHWFRSDWLGLIGDLPPIGCLARHPSRDTENHNPWFYCTTLSTAPTQLEHGLADLLRVADSGRFLLHQHDHYYPITPPPFLSLAIRQCVARLQGLLGGDPPMDIAPPPVPPSAPPRPRRYSTIRSWPGGITLGLGQSDLSSEAQWGVFALKTIDAGQRIIEYGGPLRSQAWLDTPGQTLTYVWSDIDERVSLAKYGLLPVIIDANPAYTDSWGGRINDGLGHGANVEIRRDKDSNKVFLWALEQIAPGVELTVHYGPDYWQEHFFSCPPSVQQAAAQCYALSALEGKCYQHKELRRLRTLGQAHQTRGRWVLGPRPDMTRRDPPRPNIKLRRRGCVPLPALDTLPTLPPQGDITACPLFTAPTPPSHTPEISLPIPTLSAELRPDTVPLDTGSGSDIGQDHQPPFLWLMDITSSIIEHTTQTSWGITTLATVATFLLDPAHRNMRALLTWASAYESPARFQLHHAARPTPIQPTGGSIMDLLAADYGLKARSASGIRGDQTDDWPCLADPDDLALLTAHVEHLQTLTTTSPDMRELLTTALSGDDQAPGPFPLSGTTLLSLGDPRLPYSLFEYRPGLDANVGTLPLSLTGDPRLPASRDFAWTDLLMLGHSPNFAFLDHQGLAPLTDHNPQRTEERIRWALHSLCQATVTAIEAPLPRLPRPPRRVRPSAPDRPHMAPVPAPSSPPPRPQGFPLPSWRPLPHRCSQRTPPGYSPRSHP